MSTFNAKDLNDTLSPEEERSPQVMNLIAAKLNACGCAVRIGDHDYFNPLDILELATTPDAPVDNMVPYRAFL